MHLKLDCNTVGKGGDCWVYEKVAGEDLVGSSGKGYKVTLQCGGLI